jgi:hypothetical protein
LASSFADKAVLLECVFRNTPLAAMALVSFSSLLVQPLRMLASHTSPLIIAPLLVRGVRLYHEAVHEHFENPRNVGSLDKARA